MHFFKKNGLNIIIFVLIFGVVGTLINLVIPTQSYDYEEYYTLEGDISPETVGALNIIANERVNSEFPVKTVEIEQEAGSNIFQLNIHTDNSDYIDPIQSQFESTLNDEGYTVNDTSGANLYRMEHTFLKAFIVVISLFAGFVVGTVSALLNRNISTEADFEHYLGEKTIGTF